MREERARRARKDWPRHNLPAQPTRLIGREPEIMAARRLIADDGARLLTFTGPAGVGKTRLAVAAAAALHGDYPHGAWFVDLAPITNPPLVATAIAQALALDLPPDEPPAATLRRQLRDRRLVLVLDNFEQVLDAAPLVADLLAVCPTIVALATSREPLHLRWEHEFPVSPLALPAPGELPPPDVLAVVPAVALFVARLRAVRPDFVLDEANAPIVAEVCRRLDGLPLALELAAARGRTFPPDALLARLRDGFDLLTGGPRDAPERQRTLRAAIGWSHDLLTPDEQALFRRLAVFAGGWAPEAVAPVCEPQRSPRFAIEDGVASLVDKNLLRAGGTSGTGMRYSMLAMVREYAAERLAGSGEEESLRDRHAAFFLTLAEGADAALFGPRNTPALDRLEREHDNLRGALAWFLSRGDVERSLRLGKALLWLWALRGYLTEGRGRLAEILDLARRSPAPSAAALARVLDAAGMLAARQDDYVQAQSLYEEALAHCRRIGDRRGVGRALDGLAGVAVGRGEHTTGRALYEERLALVRELGGARDLPVAHLKVSQAAFALGDLAAAHAHASEALTLYRDAGDVQRVARARQTLGLIAQQQGDRAGARALLEESLAGFSEVGYRSGIAEVVGDLGRLALDEDDPALAHRRFAESLPVLVAVGMKGRIAHLLEQTAIFVAGHGRAASALRLAAAGAALRAATGVAPSPIWQPPLDLAMTTARGQLGGGAAATAWAAG